MLSPHSGWRIHSQLSQTSLRDTYAVANREPMVINTKSAEKLGLKTGDLARVYNERGQILVGVKTYDHIREDVVIVREGVWFDPADWSEDKSICKNGHPNVLTIDMPTSKLANANISHSAIVNIEKYKGEAPELTAFKEPKFA